ncbi:hypothetical protein GCM10011415_07940 [Salipiger pallidus]|uniref:Uncharacterized protein n=1 Tax=Salipiger pallidus TaxID=1775170 RepID=A0A8J2ZHN1_9RHOB|nr:hypothetical protein [Salipiger pallidus]GGG63883.1 hypothetical protein GCM10011415_07940 [Salipiger pallidus]
MIQGVEAGEAFTSVVRMVAHAPIIDELTDAYVAPPWTGRVGDTDGGAGSVPGAPRWASVTSGLEIFEHPIAGDQLVARDITVRLAPGIGSTALLSAYRIEHRVAGPYAWASIEVPAAQGAGSIEGYQQGEVVELRALAVSRDGLEGPYSPIATITVGEDDPTLPTALDAQSITASSGLGNATITVAVPSGATTAIQLFRVPAGSELDVALHAAGDPVPVAAGSTISITDGDATRQTMLENGQFSSVSAWELGDGWTITDGYAAAIMATASETSLSQDISVSANRVLRLAYRMSDWQSGTVTPRLTGGGVVSGPSVGADGRHYVELTTLFGSSSLEFLKSADFVGKLSDVTLYQHTAACAPQGQWDYYAQPRNDAALADVAGPASTEIA